MIGRTLSHYRVTAAIGTGGMGEVYRATDTKLGRDVALKVLPAEMASNRERLERFRREAKALAALDHPGIVTVHSVEEAEDIHFLTMQLVEGQALDGVIPAEGLPVDRLLEIGSALADALAAAHERGVVHRDLKPANVMVGAHGRVKILDFGLAKVARPEGEDGLDSDLPTDVHTREGVVMGTVPYMSPEQLSGRAVDHRTDVFSLGVILYEMAVGRRPFEGGSSAELVSSILRDSPPELTERRSDLPGEIARILRSCLEKNPRDRLPSARHLHRELEALRGGTASVAAAASGASAARPDAIRSQRRSIVLATAVIVVLALGLGASLYLNLSGRGGDEATARDRRSIAVLPFSNRSADQADAFFVDGIHDELVTQLAKVDSLKVISRTSVMEYRDTTKKIPQIARELGVASILEGGVQRAGNRVRVFAQLIDAGADEHLWAETYDRELTVNNLLEIQSEMARSIVAALRATLTPEEASRLERKMTEDLPAYEAYLRAQAQLSVDDPDTRRRSIAELELAVSRDPTFAEAWASLAHANLRVFWFVEPDVTLRQRAREAIDRGRQIAPGLVSLDISEGYYHYWGFRDYERALAALAPAIRVAGGDGRLIELTSFIARRRGDFATAVSGMRRALELDPRQAGLYFTLAETYTLQERWSETLDVLEKGLLLAPEAVYGNNVKSWALIEKDRDLEGALDLFTRFGAWDVLYARLGWWIENARGEYSSALEHADLGDFADTKFSYLPPALQRGLTHLYAGDAPSAKRELEAARRYVERRRDQDPDDPRVHRSLCVIHGALRMTGAADRSCARAVEGLSRDAFEAGYLRVEIATGLALAGLNDRALDMIELYLREPSGYGPVRTELEPAFRGLRADPRFAALLDRSRHQTD